MSPEQRLLSLGLEFPKLHLPMANYVPSVRTGNLVFVSGQIPIRDGKIVCKGRIGEDLTEEEGYLAARLTATNALAVLRQQIGSLNAVHKIVKITVWVRGSAGFDRQHLIANGASDLLIEIFREQGQHARSAVSAPDLPFQSAVEMELVAEVT